MTSSAPASQALAGIVPEGVQTLSLPSPGRREAIEVVPVIGEGEFGSVFEGRYKSSRGETSNIAIKVIHDVTPPQMEDFMREAAVLMRLDHQCVVQMIGISKGAQVMMLLELVPLGSLLDYLLEHQDAINSSMEIPLWVYVKLHSSWKNLP